MNKNKKKQKNDSSRPLKGKRVEFSIEKEKLITIIILILSLFIVLGCVSKNKVRETAMCYDGSTSITGWVSAKTSHSYWVVDETGKTMEFSRNKCSIKR